MKNIKDTIPFNRPFIIGKELFYIAQSVLSGHIAGDGVFTKKCQSLMETKFSAKKVLLTHSCTAALEMAAILCDVCPGDEVILPSFTFVSTANAFFLRGAKPIFVDIHPETLNMDETLIENLITSNTKVIVPVHYAGVACNMDKIVSIAQKYNLYVVEDAAQAVNAKYKNQFLGTIGDIGAYSFHETKNYISGEGGAIIINNEKFIERAEIIREKGTNRSKFFRGEVDKYTWVDVGSSYLPSDITAAFLFAQLENMDVILKRRGEIFKTYQTALAPLLNDGKLYFSYPDEHRHNSNNHIFYIILNSEKERNELMDYLKTRGILSVFHYIPLHLSPMGLSIGYRKGQFPVTESLSSRQLRLPVYFDLKCEEQTEIVNSIKDYFITA